MEPASEDVRRQRAYYSETAASYAARHVSDDDEHMIALGLFAGLARRLPHGSFLDVGAGTGRAVRFLKREFPNARVLGVEPAPELRQAGLAVGDLSPEDLRDGDATRLPFADGEFDWVVETGVLHHIRDYRAAVREMARVARIGVLISDSNNMGQGGPIARGVKRLIKGLGLWDLAVLAQTRGKGYKWSEGDGVYYSFCAFDCVALLRPKFPRLTFANTGPAGFDLYGSAPHVAIIAFRQSGDVRA